jgi:O-antigen/teichoic acid export membrane protein
MALTEAQKQPVRRTLLRLPARVQAWLAGEHAAAQRMAGAAFAIRVGGAGIIFLSQILLARWMGSFEFGIYVYAWTWVLLVGDILHLGLPITAQRYIPEYTQHGDLDRLRGFIAGSRWMVFGAATAAAIAGAIVVWAVDPWLDRNTILPLYLACVTLPFYALSALLDGQSRCYDAVHIALLPPYVLRPLLLLAIMAAVHFSGNMTDASMAMAVFAFTTWTATLLQLAMLQRHLRNDIPTGPKLYDFRNWLATSIPVLAVWAFFTLLTYTDVLVLRQFQPPEEVAHYYAAAKTLSLVTFIYFSVTAAVAHRIASIHVSGDQDALASFASTTVRWTFWPSLLATIGILALGKPILWLFGPDFVSAYPLMFILAIGLIARSAVGPAERMLNVMGEQRMCAMVYACAFTINLTGALILVPRFGAVGAAIALVSAVLCETAMLFAVAKKRLNLHLFVWQPRSKS